MGQYDSVNVENFKRRASQRFNAENRREICLTLCEALRFTLRGSALKDCPIERTNSNCIEYCPPQDDKRDRSFLSYCELTRLKIYAVLLDSLPVTITRSPEILTTSP